ncbi:DoxX family protein [Planctobacterium marinum]|uniref:Membrane protein n=1 Tax=Planctobacterium marinum TaxID=1631968 RepID=A0AA48HNM1_9ALTE|nr:membrane protein [Planctobacterium marinum]
MKTEILTFDQNGTLASIIDVIARVLLSTLFLLAGSNKISAYEGTAGWMEAMGVPGGLLPLVIFAEIGGALALILGFQTRLVALGLAVFSIASALVFHNNIADQAEFLNFFKNLSMAGGFLVLSINGAKKFSLDAQFNK